MIELIASVGMMERGIRFCKALMVDTASKEERAASSRSVADFEG